MNIKKGHPKEHENDLQAVVGQELDQLLKQVKQKRSALQKMAKIIQTKNQYESSDDKEKK